VPSFSYSEFTTQPTAQERVAVLDFKSEEADRAAANVISNMLLTDLVNDGRFTVVERTQMETILREQSFQQTGCTDDSCAVKMGRLLSANKIVFGELSRVNDTMYITVRVIDVARGITDHAERGVIQKSDGIDNTVSRIAIKLMDKMARRTKRGFNIGPLITGRAPSGIMMEYNMFIPSNSEITNFYDRFYGGSAGYTYPINTYFSAIGKMSYMMARNEKYSATMSFNSYHAGVRIGFPLLGVIYPYIGISFIGTWIYEKGKMESAYFFGYGADGSAGTAVQVSRNFTMYGAFTYSYCRVTDEKVTDNSGRTFSIGIMYNLCQE